MKVNKLTKKELIELKSEVEEELRKRAKTLKLTIVNNIPTFVYGNVVLAYICGRKFNLNVSSHVIEAEIDKFEENTVLYRGLELRMSSDGVLSYGGDFIYDFGRMRPISSCNPETPIDKWEIGTIVVYTFGNEDN